MCHGRVNTQKNVKLLRNNRGMYGQSNRQRKFEVLEPYRYGSQEVYERRLLATERHQLRENLYVLLATFAKCWYKRGFRRGHMES
jgi:hypothetical protein